MIDIRIIDIMRKIGNSMLIILDLSAFSIVISLCICMVFFTYKMNRYGLMIVSLIGSLHAILLFFARIKEYYDSGWKFKTN